MTKELPLKSLVLYADDDPDDIDLVRDVFLNYPGITLVTFSDGRELLRYIERRKPVDSTPCLVILDINMPRLDGKETLKVLRQTAGFETVPAVLFSTSRHSRDTSFAQTMNAGFVTKPLHGDQIELIGEHLIEFCSDEVKERLRAERDK
jgi:CheY-like chemotaxis protein